VGRLPSALADRRRPQPKPGWIVAIVIMALGLGSTVPNSRRDRVDVINQQADRPPSGRRTRFNSLPVGPIIPPSDHFECILMRGL
jgi:hypothetical protein